jgi:hypothetical protein
VTNISAARATLSLILLQVMVFPLAIVSLVCVVQSGVSVMTVWRRVYISACSSSAALELPYFLSPTSLPDSTPHTGPYADQLPLEAPPISVIRYGPGRWLQTGGPLAAGGLRGLRRTGQLRG